MITFAFLPAFHTGSVQLQRAPLHNQQLILGDPVYACATVWLCDAPVMLSLDWGGEMW